MGKIFVETIFINLKFTLNFESVVEDNNPWPIGMKQQTKNIPSFCNHTIDLPTTNN